MSENQLNQRKFRAGRFVVLVPFTLLAAMGCAQVIGLGDYTVASDNGGAGGSSGKTGTGGKSGSAGKAFGGEAGAEEAGTGGKSGSGAGGSSVIGTGGEGGTAPIAPAVGCDGKTPIDINAQVVQSCILRVGCSPFDPVRSISTCVTNNTQDAFAGEKCNLQSTTCDEYSACEHNGIAGDDLCPEAKWGTNFCVGTKSVYCTQNGQFSSFVDCTGAGATGCGQYVDPTTPGSEVTACTLTNESCAGSLTTDLVCSDEATPVYEYRCVGGKAYGSKCGDFAYCGTDTNDEATCFLTAQSCGADSTTCSASNVAKVCSGGGEYDYNCGSVGLTCNATGAATEDTDTSYCLAPGCKPADLGTCVESCDGSKLTFCYGGAPVTVDCVDYNFSTCDTFSTQADADGNPGWSYAACVNE